MAVLKLIVDVIGGTPVELTATALDPMPVVLVGMESKTVRFAVANPLARDVILTNLTPEVTGPAAEKLGAVTQSAGMDFTVPALGTLEISIVLIPLAPILEGETATVTVLAHE